MSYSMSEVSGRHVGQSMTKENEVATEEQLLVTEVVGIEQTKERSIHYKSTSTVTNTTQFLCIADFMGDDLTKYRGLSRMDRYQLYKDCRHALYVLSDLMFLSWSTVLYLLV